MDIKKHKLGLSYRSKPKYLTRDYILDTKRNLNQKPFTHTPLNRDETRGPDIYQIQNELNKYRRKDDQLKTYDNLDKTSYPSDPLQQKKLKAAVRLKDLSKLKIKTPDKPKKKVISDNFLIDVSSLTSGLSGDLNQYIQLRKEMKNQVLPKETSKPTENPKGGIVNVLDSDVIFRRKNGLDF